MRIKAFPQPWWMRRKKGKLASNTFEQNSIPGLAESWSEAVAGEGRTSPSESWMR